MLTPDDVAEQLNLSRRKVLELARLREIESVHVSHKVIRFTQQAVDQLRMPFRAGHGVP
jgi:excisionase family DNA binding protein